MSSLASDRWPGPSWPVPPTPLLGREDAVAALGALLSEDETRLVTVTGPGGVGKTRIVLAVLEELARDGDGNAVFVSLESVRDPDLLITALAGALDLREAGATALFDLVAGALKERSTLLVLDNLEQIAAGAAAPIARLLAACPGLTILATSRVPLAIRGERQNALPPLSLPEDGRDDLAANPAVALFVERAQAVRPDFELTERNQADVVALCRRLDGLPLAIELAAARSKLLSPAAILARLTNRLQVLDGGARDLPVRQQTMRDAIVWSYELLSPEYQAVFRRLAVFPASFSLAAAEEILGGAPGTSGRATIREAVAELVDHSLLVVVPDPEDEPRLRMLQPIRDVALALLDESEEIATWVGAHARYFATVADEIRSGLTSPAPAVASEYSERELPNLVAAIDAFADAGDAEGALTVASGIWRFWYRRGRFHEGLAKLKRALATPGATAALRAAALNGFGAHLDAVGQADAALAAYEEAIPLWTEVGDQRGLASTLSNRALLLLHRARYQEAVAGFEHAATIVTAIGDDWRAAAVLDNIGLALVETGDHARAADHHARALATRRAIGDDAGMATSLHNLSVAVARGGDVAHALALADEARVIRERIGDRPGLAYTLNSLGFLASESGDFRTAELRMQEALALYQELGQPQGVALALHNLASTAFEMGDPERALSLFRESLALRRHYGGPRDLVFTLRGFAGVALASRQIELATHLAAAATGLAEQTGAFLAHPDEEIQAIRSELGERQFARLWEDGRVPSVEQAVALTELVSAVPGEERGDPTTPAAPREVPAPKPSDHGLTARELDVLRLVAKGKTNADIGEALFISPFTAKTHVANLLGKLGVESRAAASTWAAQQGLL